MKILVLDDKPIQRDAANILLAGHDLTIVSTFDEAAEVLELKEDNVAWGRLFDERGGQKLEGKERGMFLKRCKREATKYPDFDVVLTDMMMPASRRNLCKEARSKYLEQEMPLGLVVALLALRNGIKNVAIVSDMNHHTHPVAAAFDYFVGVPSGNEPVKVCGATAFLDETNRRVFDHETLYISEPKRFHRKSELVNGIYEDVFEGLVCVKDWRYALSLFL